MKQGIGASDIAKLKSNNIHTVAVSLTIYGLVSTIIDLIVEPDLNSHQKTPQNQRIFGHQSREDQRSWKEAIRIMVFYV